MKEERSEDGIEYYNYIVFFVDDILCLNKNPERYLSLLGMDFRLKAPPETPRMYLG